MDTWTELVWLSFTFLLAQKTVEQILKEMGKDVGHLTNAAAAEPQAGEAAQAGGDLAVPAAAPAAKKGRR